MAFVVPPVVVQPESAVPDMVRLFAKVLLRSLTSFNHNLWTLMLPWISASVPLLPIVSDVAATLINEPFTLVG